VAAVPENRTAMGAAEKTCLSLIHVGVNPVLNLAFIHHLAEFNIAVDTAAEKLGLGIQAEFFDDHFELQGRVGFGQDNALANSWVLLCEVGVAGDKNSARCICSLDKVMGADAHVPIGIITDNAQIFSQPDDHVI